MADDFQSRLVKNEVFWHPGSMDTSRYETAQVAERLINVPEEDFALVVDEVVSDPGSDFSDMGRLPIDRLLELTNTAFALGETRDAGLLNLVNNLMWRHEVPLDQMLTVVEGAIDRGVQMRELQSSLMYALRTALSEHSEIEIPTDRLAKVVHQTHDDEGLPTFVGARELNQAFCSALVARGDVDTLQVLSEDPRGGKTAWGARVSMSIRKPSAEISVGDDVGSVSYLR